MKTSLEFIVMELEYKRIMVTLKSTELEKLKAKKDELEARYKCEVKLRDELFDLLFSVPKRIDIEEGGIDREGIREKGEERGENREKRWEKREEIGGNREKRWEKKEEREREIEKR